MIRHMASMEAHARQIASITPIRQFNAVAPALTVIVGYQRVPGYGVH